MLFDHKQARSIDDHFHLQIKRYQLKQRVANACRENINYSQQLIDFCTSNKHNSILLIRVKSYYKYLIDGGSTHRQAAKLCLEFYRH